MNISTGDDPEADEATDKDDDTIPCRKCGKDSLFVKMGLSTTLINSLYFHQVAICYMKAGEYFKDSYFEATLPGLGPVLERHVTRERSICLQSLQYYPCLLANESL